MLEKNFWFKEIFGPKNFLKKIWSKKMFGPKIFGQKKIFGPEKFRSKMLLVQKVLVQTDLGGLYLVSQRYSRPLVSSLFLGRLPFLCHPHFSVRLHL